MSGTAPLTGTATRPGGSRPGVPGPVAAVLRAPFTRRAWAELGYAMAGLPLGVAGFAFTVATLAAGAALTLTVIGILVGLPLLAVSSLGARGLGRCLQSSVTWSRKTTRRPPGTSRLF